jgi:hypothetical protein
MLLFWMMDLIKFGVSGGQKIEFQEIKTGDFLKIAKFYLLKYDFLIRCNFKQLHYRHF